MTVHQLFAPRQASPTCLDEDAAPSSQATAPAELGATTRRQVAIQMAEAWLRDGEARRAYLAADYIDRGITDPGTLVAATELGLATATIRGLLEVIG